jgi:hypothetical protein
MTYCQVSNAVMNSDSLANANPNSDDAKRNGDILAHFIQFSSRMFCSTTTTTGE